MDLNRNSQCGRLKLKVAISGETAFTAELKRLLRNSPEFKAM